jgi:hypothetical protein
LGSQSSSHSASSFWPGGIGGGGLEGEHGYVIAMAGGTGFAQVEDDGGAHGVLIDEAARGGRCVVVHHVMAFDVLDEVLQGVGCHGAAEAVAHRLE